MKHKHTQADIHAMINPITRYQLQKSRADTTMLKENTTRAMAT